MWRRGVDRSPAADARTGVSFRIRIRAGCRGACFNVDIRARNGERIRGKSIIHLQTSLHCINVAF